MCYRCLVGLLVVLFGDLVVIGSENRTRVIERIPLFHENGTIEENLDFNSSAKPKTYTFDDRSCPKSTCSNYSGDGDDLASIFRVGHSSCNCDKACVDFRDCCSDSKYYDGEEQKKPIEYECRSDYYYVKITCPSSWRNNEINEKCQMSRDYLNLNIKDVELRIPATSLKTHITYGNIYCAMCNAENNVKLWNVKIVYECKFDNSNYTACTDMEKITIDKLQFYNDRWHFIHNDTLHRCNLTIHGPEDAWFYHCWGSFFVNTCPMTWTDLDMKEKCDGPYSGVLDVRHAAVYRNKYCAYCNGVNDSSLSCYPPSMGGSSSGTNSLTMLFDFKLQIPSKLCKNNHTSLAQQQICLIEENATYISSDENWFFSAYTSVAISISLICLIVHLTIFSFVQELHTIGGKNMASYCVALTLAYGTFLLGNLAEGVVCVTTAVLMYYFFLSAFTWMLTISYDIWRTCWNVIKHLRSPSDTKKTFLWYSLWSWSAPLIPVLITIYLQYFEIDYALAPHFGESSCWFQNGYSLSVFFVGPVCLIITVNFAFFLHTSVMVYNNQCPSVNQKPHVDFKIFARIAILTGFTWITGFVGGYTESLIIWFIFIVLNTAQGVFIFIAFSCKKRIVYSFLKRIDMFENWQIMLEESMTRSNDTKSTVLNNVVQTIGT